MNSRIDNDMNKRNIILKGMRDGIPIGLGYYAVAFSLGIIAGKAGLNALTGFFSSLFTRASAGEYSVYSLVVVDATYYEVFLISIIANMRYLLMNTALSQKFSPETNIFKRILVGACCTDEIFGISIAYDGYIEPIYVYGATLVAAPLWALGTFSGILAGNILPARYVSALSVALYGMFIAIIIPAGKKDRTVLLAIITSFILSFIFAYTVLGTYISSGIRTILLTVVVSALFAIIKPINQEVESN